MKKQPLFILVTLLLTTLLLSSCNPGYTYLEQSPGDYLLTTEEQLLEPTHCSAIDDFYDQGIEGSFMGQNQVEIVCRTFIQPGEEEGAVVISTGRTEAALKYRELIYDLYNNGYSVYIHDHRGQGLSGRMAEDSEMGHVDDFQYYIDDMKSFYDGNVKPGDHEKVFLLAHSMGGTIGISYLEQFPEDFEAAAFSSPMLGLSAYICPLARILAGKTPKYAPGQTGYTDDSTKFEGNDVTGSQIRYFLKIAAYNEVPESRVGGVSVQWLHQSCMQIRDIFRNIDKIETPMLIFIAGNETVVNPKATQKFADKAIKAGKECSAFTVENTMHELLMEQDLPRTMVLTRILAYFSGGE